MYDNQREITLTFISTKPFTLTLHDRVIPATRSRQRPQQAGFTFAFPPLLSAFRFLMEKFREYRKDHHLYVAFIDAKATFDTTDVVEYPVNPRLPAEELLWHSTQRLRTNRPSLRRSRKDTRRFQRGDKASAARKPKPKLMYVGDGPDLPPILIGNDPRRVRYVFRLPVLRSFNTTVRYSMRRRNPQLLHSWLRITHVRTIEGMHCSYLVSNEEIRQRSGQL